MPTQTLAPAAPLSAAAWGEDETGWLDATAVALRAGDVAAVDLPSLAEYLEDMARRDRREVISRLVVLVAHILKWECQPDRRSRSWLATVNTQRFELSVDVSGGALRRHVLDSEAVIWAAARKQAAVETGLPVAAFPADPVGGLDDWMTVELVGEVPD